MFDEFFDFGSVIDYGSFDVDFSSAFSTDALDFTTFDAAGFDLGGVTDFSDIGADAFTSDFVDPSFGGDYFQQAELPEFTPNDFGTVWESDFPVSADGGAMTDIFGNVSAGDAVKVGTSIYGASQSGTPAPSTRTTAGTANPNTSPSTASNWIQSLLGTARDVVQTATNIEDAGKRVTGSQTTTNPNRTLTGSKPTTRAGSATKPGSAGASAMPVNPALLALAGVGAFLAFRGR